MENIEKVLIGRYYVRLKSVHINWTHKTGPKRSNEAYIPIPAEYAYMFNIRKSEIYTCTYLESGATVTLKAAGSQSRREYAKQFQGAENLRILYDWYSQNQATEGDWVVVSIYDNQHVSVEFISQANINRVAELHLIGDKGRPEEVALVSNVNLTGLRLVSLVVKDNDRVICDYQFFPPEFTSNVSEPLCTLIIGANSTGKSFAMKILSEIFQAVNNESVSKHLPYDSYCLKYYLGENVIEIEIINRAIVIHKNNILIEKPDETVLPQKVLAIAFMLNDKFAFKAESQDESSIYEYLGLRKTSNASWISTFGNRVAENVLELACTQKLWPLIQSLSTYLNIDPQISISYEVSQSFFGLKQIRKMSIMALKEEIRAQAYHLVNKGGFRKNAIAKLDDRDFHKMAAFLKGLESCDPFIPGYDQLIFGHTFSDKTQQHHIQEIRNDYRMIKALQNLHIIKDITLHISKHGHRYSFDECSSGEKHILYAILNIARYIRENSLILIDEPEISLHPNWQIRYISALKQMFRDYSSCHIIITSHSPYLVSDLKPESSSLITLKLEDGVRTASTLNYSTYAWSAENILYNIFHVRTTRNFYFDIELRELLHYISHNRIEKLQDINRLYSKLSGYVFNSRDPLNFILDEVKEYIENAESESSSGTN